MRDVFSGHVSVSDSESKIHPSELRVLLWDIDGTLLQSTRPGSFREYFAPALEKVFGTRGRISEVGASGATDTQIVFNSLKDEGFAVEEITARIKEFVEVLEIEMRKHLALNKENYEILPGVKEILRAASGNPRFVNSLLTGNVSCGAEIKCRTVGIWEYFEKSLNTYGDVSHDRRQLAVAAGKNFNELYQFNFSPSQFLVIGDTTADIATAKYFGAKCLSVATGRGIEPDNLKAAAPDFLIDDLRDTQEVLNIFESF
jgi:phosphoglycolate phosphatase-like HAD superfamily hydrolase